MKKGTKKYKLHFRKEFPVFISYKMYVKIKKNDVNGQVNE